MLRWLPPRLLAVLWVVAGCSELPQTVAFDGPWRALDGGAADGCGVPIACDILFSYTDPGASATSVDLHGSFNSWKTGVAMEHGGSGLWRATQSLSHGERVEYKFFVDGATWVNDPNNPHTTSDAYNNSILHVSCPSSCSDGPRHDGAQPGDGVSGPDGDPPPFDWRDGVMYFVLLDRFSDGDTSNNQPEIGVEQPANFQGGDLAGLLAKLQTNYFTQLGVNVLWLSAPVDAPEGKYLGSDGHEHTGYHGYWPAELDQMEVRLGDLSLLKQVVQEAHSRGIRVILDYVMNHVHQTSSTYTANPSWFWPLDMGGTDCICGAGCTWDAPQGLRCWFDPFLPAFDFTNAQARKFSVDNAIKWITDTGVDGYRLDAVKHVEESWLTDLRQRIANEVLQPGQRFYLIGETFDGKPDLLKQHVDPATKLDGQFDFPLRAQLVKVILMRQGSFADLDTFLSTNDGFYGADAVMGTFLGNHDLPRVIHLAEDTPQFGEWDRGKSRAWVNQPALPGNAQPFERLAVAFTALLTLPGLPTIYYGDEIGMAGGGDPDNRRPMVWSGTNTDQDKLRAHVSKLIGLRHGHPALRRGSPQQLWISADVYAYLMSQGTDQLVVVLNRSDSEQTIQLAGYATMQDLLSGATVNAASLKVPARSSLVLQ
jgi:glycosidase